MPLLYFKQRLEIYCPMCGKPQTMEYDTNSHIWFAIPKFCCDAMQLLDSHNWNTLLDLAIETALATRRK